MKPLAALLLCTVLCAGFLGCGDSSKSARTRGASVPVSAQAHSSSTSTKRDRDEDYDNNDDDYYVLGFGRPAGATDAQAITTLVRRYFASAAAENGAEACALITPFFAETVVEQYGHTPQLRGNTCAAVMSKLFKNNHKEIAAKNSHLKVMRIGVEGDVARVGLEFPEIPTITQIRIRRQGKRWTVLDLLDHLIE